MVGAPPPWSRTEPQHQRNHRKPPSTTASSSIGLPSLHPLSSARSSPAARGLPRRPAFRRGSAACSTHPDLTLPPRALHRLRRPRYPPRHPGLRPPPPSPSVDPRAGGLLRLPRLACRGVATSCAHRRDELRLFCCGLFVLRDPWDWIIHIAIHGLSLLETAT